MHCLKGGMHNLPKSFFNSGILNTDDIEYKKQVYEINYWCKDDCPLKDFVEVSCYSNSGASSVYKGKVSLINRNYFSRKCLLNLLLYESVQ